MLWRRSCHASATNSTSFCQNGNCAGDGQQVRLNAGNGAEIAMSSGVNAQLRGLPVAVVVTPAFGQSVVQPDAFANMAFQDPVEP